MTFFKKLSFQAKLLLSFALIITLTTALGYFLVHIAIDRAFERFAQHSFRNQSVVPLRLLASYYERTGSWAGLDRFLNPNREQLPFVLVNSQGTVVLAPNGYRGEEKLPLDDLEKGEPIRVNGRTVGTLLPLSLTPRKGLVEQGFLRTASRALWIAAWSAGAIGILLSIVLLRQLTGPLKELETAAQQIAQGQLSNRVSVHSHDDLGRLAESFNEMAASLEEAERTKRQMIADVSHELRTPISVVRTALEGLRDGVLEATPENFAALHNKILLTGRLVADLQELALADAGQLSIRKQACDVRRLLEHIQATIEVQLEDEGIKLVVEAPDDLPAVEADDQRIEQVILNLLSNAMCHTPAGGVIRILTHTLDRQLLQISVCDSGPGLSGEDLSHVFDRFYRADKARARGTGGAGLGLAIAKALVEAHGGRIWAENAPGGGACFHFTLPLATTA